MPRLINAEKQGTFCHKSRGKAFIFVQVLLLISCQQNAINNKSVLKDREIELAIKKPDTILNSIIGYVDKQSFTMACTSQYNLFLLNEKGDTVYQDSVFSPYQKFVDFNGDGFNDILIEYMTNIPGIMDLLIYDKAERTYKRVVGFQNFPGPQQIANSKYYYSYHRSGCADMNWDSDLFYIENYKTVKIGNISVNQCNDTGINDGIYINKIDGKNRMEIGRLPIKIIKQYKEHKWGFIKKYWQENYKRFLSD